MVKFAPFVFVAGLLAASAAASSAIDVNDFESRDAAEYEELFSRCKIVDGKAIGACKKGRTYSRELDVDEIEERSFEELDEFAARDLEPLSDAGELFTRCKGCVRGHSPRDLEPLSYAEELFARCKIINGKATGSGCKASRAPRPRELDVDEIEAREFYARDIQEYDELTARDLEPLSYAEELFARCKVVNGKATGSGCGKWIPAPRELDVDDIEARNLQEFDELTARDVELLSRVNDLLSRYYEDLEMRTPEKDGKIYACTRKTARDLEEAEEVAARELGDVELEAYTPARRGGTQGPPQCLWLRRTGIEERYG